jgi:hypothetical protein
MNTLNVLIIGGFFSISIIVPMDLATTKDPEVVRIAREYNSTIPLIACPDEISEKIFSYVADINQPMGKSIKNILAISATCRYFDDSLEWFGELLKPYSTEAKDQMLKIAMYHSASWRRSNLLMACSGLSDTQYSRDVLGDAVIVNDLYLAELLLKNGVSPNIIHSPILDKPVFFYIENPDMATVFANHNIDFNYVSENYLNILWFKFNGISGRNNFSEMIQFYLKKGVNSALLNSRNGQCLLHHIAKNFKNDRHPADKKPYMDGICHVLEATKEQINTIDNEGNTPLDIFIKKLAQPIKYCNYTDESDASYRREIFDMTFLFRFSGAKTAEELKSK